MIIFMENLAEVAPRILMLEEEKDKLSLNQLVTILA